MKYKNIVLLISILTNIILITYINMRNNQIDDTLSSLTFNIQSDLVQLEGAIDYQVTNKWKDGNFVIEKIEDVMEGINYIMRTGKDSGSITKQQEQELWSLHRFLSHYPGYTGFPNTLLNSNQRRELEELGNKLKTAGWGMNIGYSGGWESFSESLKILIE